MKEELADAVLYQVIFDSSIAGFFIVDNEGSILKSNLSGERMFGYGVGAMAGKKMEYLFVDSFKSAYEFQLKKTRSEPIQLTASTKGGKKFPMDVRIAPTQLNGDNYAAVYCKPAGISVFESDRKLRALIGNAPGIVYRCKIDSLWTMEFISDFCLAISGYPPEKFYGDGNISWGNLIHPEDRTKVWEEVQKAISKKKKFQLSYRIITADNETKWIWEQGLGVADENGKMHRLEGFMQDVTEQVVGEQKLRDSEEKNRAILEALPDVMTIHDCKGTILELHVPDESYLIAPIEELKGKNVKELLPEEVSAKLIRLFAKVLRTQKIETFEVTAPVANGTADYECRLVPLANAKVMTLARDISGKTIVARKLLDSQARNEAIVQALPDALIVHDIEGNYVDLQVSDTNNPVFPPMEIIGKNIYECIPKEKADELIALLSKAHQTKTLQVIESHLTIDDRTFDYESRVVPLEENKLLVIMRDITKSKALQQLVDTRNKALDAAGNGIVIVDAQNPDLPITYCNTAFTEMTGYSRKEIIGINCQFLQNDDRDQEAIATMAKAIGKGEACHVLLRNYRKDGSLFWNDLTITPLYNDDDVLTNFIGVQNDVTEIQEARKQLQEHADKLEEKVAERTREIESTVQKLVETNLNLEDQIQLTRLIENKVQRSQAQFAAIAKNFPKGLIVVFNSDFELAYVEGEELKRVDLKKADFEGKRVDDLPIFSTEQVDSIKKNILKTIKGESLSFEMEFQDNYYAVNSTPLRSDVDTIIWALFVYHNITDQRKVQEKLAKALKVEQELNDLKSRFISMASHEFRTPLSAILSSAILIGKQNEPGKEERRMKHVTRIRNNVKNLVVILNDFLSLSKLEEGNVKANPQHFELVQFAKLLLEEMESVKKDGQTILFTHTDATVPVFLDPKLVSHILINLVSNALKYSHEGDEVILELQKFGEGVIFNIVDEGIGIPKSEQKSLFERFFRAGNVTNIQGTGLGLHIVRQYSELMEGTVSFESKIGKGSTFTLTLPLNLKRHEENTGNRG